MASTQQQQQQTAGSDFSRHSADLFRTSSSSDERKNRPSLFPRQNSKTSIRRDDAGDVQDEPGNENDARTMSPRKSVDEIAQLGDEARRALEEHARTLQASLLEIVERVESVRAEHAKLEGGNQFLQSYIGELMQTSKITSTGAGGKATKARAVRPNRS